MDMGTYAVGAEYKGGFFTPGAVLDEMRVLDSAIESFSLDVSRSSVSPRFKTEAERYRKEWKSFYDARQGWLDRALNKTYGMVQEFRARLTSYRKEFERLGGKLTAPALPEPKGVNWKLALGVGVGVGVLMWWGLGKLSRS